MTGATGFVGGHLCARLAAEGHEVLALARATSNRKLLEEAGARIIEGTVDSTNVFARHAGDCDVFFHLAAVTRAPRARTFFEVNTRGTRSVLRGIGRAGFAGRLVLLSSLAAGGPALRGGEARREEDTDAPVSQYGRSKLAAESLLRKLHPSAYTWTILRPGAIYGPREHEIYQILRMLQRSGIAVRLGRGVRVQMTHVEDVVSALMLAATVPEAASKTYYINDASVYSFEHIMGLAGENLGRRVRTVPVPMVAGMALAQAIDVASRMAGRPLSPLGVDKLAEMKAGAWIADASLAARQLGWKVRWSLPEGMKQTIAWYRENGWL